MILVNGENGTVRQYDLRFLKQGDTECVRSASRERNRAHASLRMDID